MIGRYRITDQMRIDLKTIMRTLNWTQERLAASLKCTQSEVSFILNKRTQAVFEDRWNTIVNFLYKFYPNAHYPKIRFYQSNQEQGNAQRTERPGPAHLCINGKLICGEDDYTNKRYYRKHTDWLNQVEICPKCLEAWQKAEAIWNKNQQ